MNAELEAFDQADCARRLFVVQRQKDCHNLIGTEQIGDRPTSEGCPHSGRGFRDSRRFLASANSGCVASASFQYSRNFWYSVAAIAFSPFSSYTRPSR